MRRLLAVCFLVCFFQMLAFSQQLPPLVAEQGYADTIVVNGKIVTMDDRSSVPNTPGHIVDAMAIKGKRIMAVGSDAEMRELAGPKTRFVDVGDRTVIPGLIQTHYHLFGGAAREYGPQVGLVDSSVKLTVVAETTAEATAKKIRDTIVNAIRVQQLPRGQWITVDLREGPENRRATTYTWLYLGNINRRQIDSGTEGYPVLVKTGLQGVFNTTAINEFKKVFPDWEESTDMENRPGAGRDGYAAVPEIQGLSFSYWWKDEPLDKLAEALRLQGEDVIQKGITTVATRILFPTVIAAYNKLNREGKMPHRLAYYMESQRGNFFNQKSIHEFYKGTGAPWTNHANGGEMLWLNGMCNEVWDSIYNEVCMGPDMPNAPADVKARERCPSPGTKPWESFKEAIVYGWRPVQGHATSSHGARLYIQMMEQAMKEGNYSVEYMRNLRTTLEHNILLGNVPEIMDKIKQYGIIINVNMGMLRDIPENIKDYGEGLREFVMPVKTWINDGVRVTFEAAGMDFWTPIYSLVTRKIPARRGDGEPVLVRPEEAIDRVSALKMATIWASEYMMAEDTIGTLEPGKYADFAVLEKDFFTMPIEEVPNLKVIATGLNGQLVYGQSQLGGGN
ncbi:amidohydrolase family protein [Acidobacteria bacterium AH-259-D05]|nr:amidohydrolase family protein [Acidobacteria bacterium AH-259-D05]